VSVGCAKKYYVRRYISAGKVESGDACIMLNQLGLKNYPILTGNSQVINELLNQLKANSKLLLSF
jgi:hypothetical protein